MMIVTILCYIDSKASLPRFLLGSLFDIELGHRVLLGVWVQGMHKESNCSRLHTLPPVPQTNLDARSSLAEL